MSKPAAKPAAAGEEKPKSKKMLIIVAAVLVLAIGGGVGFFMMGGKHPEEEEAHAEPAAHPVFVTLDTFTVNLQREDGDQFLQIGLSLKVMDPKLEEEIKANMPEIRSKLLLLLSSKRASELSTPEGKRALANEIVEETNGVLGAGEPQEEAPAKGKKSKHAPKAKEGVEDVLFTSFIIQ
jgi:flagellar FliL protein